MLWILPLQLMAGSFNIACSSAEPDGSPLIQHACCPDGQDSAPSHDLQCEKRCTFCPNNGVQYGLRQTETVLVRSERFFVTEHAATFPTAPYFPLLRPPRG
jgi:hypothetical protein